VRGIPSTGISAECVNRIVLLIAKFHRADAVHQLDQFFVALCHRTAEFVAVYVNIVEQALEIVLAVRALRRRLNIAEDAFLFRNNRIR